MLPKYSEDMMDISTNEIITDEPTFEEKFFRSPSCNVLLTGIDTCKECNSHVARKRKLTNKKHKLQATPASKKATISLTSPDRILLTIRRQREENASLQEICKLKDEIACSAVHEDQN